MREHSKKVNYTEKFKYDPANKNKVIPILNIDVSDDAMSEEI